MKIEDKDYLSSVIYLNKYRCHYTNNADDILDYINTWSDEIKNLFFIGLKDKQTRTVIFPFISQEKYYGVIYKVPYDVSTDLQMIYSSEGIENVESYLFENLKLNEEQREGLHLCLNQLLQ